MPRSNSHTHHPRFARYTAQIVVEGYTEEAFCKHLKRQFGRGCGVRVEVSNARGGAPKEVVRIALNRKGFDRSLVLFDTDRSLPKSWKAKARSAGVELVTPSPCMEALLLELLGKPVPRDTDGCKKAFDALLPPPAKYTPEGYEGLYPKERLQAGTNALLDKLLSLFCPPE